MTKAIRVFCADDNELLANAVQAKIAGHPHLAWAGWIESTDDLIAALTRSKADILLLDIDMPGRDVFEVLSRLTQQVPHVRALMFSAYVRSDYLDRAIEAGAWGYASKNDSIESVLDAVVKVAKGEFVLTPEVESEQRRKMQSIST